MGKRSKIRKTQKQIQQRDRTEKNKKHNHQKQNPLQLNAHEVERILDETNAKATMDTDQTRTRARNYSTPLQHAVTAQQALIAKCTDTKKHTIPQNNNKNRII